MAKLHDGKASKTFDHKIRNLESLLASCYNIPMTGENECSPNWIPLLPGIALDIRGQADLLAITSSLKESVSNQFVDERSCLVDQALILMLIYSNSFMNAF